LTSIEGFGFDLLLYLFASELNNRSAVIELVLVASEWNYKSADILKGVFVSLFELRYFVSLVADLHLTFLLYA
jgi:hypothetical protein